MRVSIVIPVYNAERHLFRCLESIFAQSYENIEVIAVNDGSSDGSAEILRAFEARYPDRFAFVSQPNAGAASARNRGIAMATGDYLCFVDNDDYLDPDFLETLVRQAESADADIVFSGYRRPDENGAIVVEALTNPDDEWAPFAVEAAWAKLYKTSFVRVHDLAFLDVNILEDLYFSLPAVAYAQRVAVAPYCGYNWFFNRESVSNTKQKSSEGLQFERSIDAILDAVEKAAGSAEGLYLHCMVRLVAWFLLFTCKGDSSVERRSNYERYTAWLDRRLPSWRNDEYAAIGRPRGDARLNQCAVWLFAKHPRLFKIALSAYAKTG